MMAAWVGFERETGLRALLHYNNFCFSKAMLLCYNAIMALNSTEIDALKALRRFSTDPDPSLESFAKLVSNLHPDMSYVILTVILKNTTLSPDVLQTLVSSKLALMTSQDFAKIIDRTLADRD